MTRNDRLRILYVSYPLLPVSDESAGGAEQMLCILEREMHARGHLTTVAACEGSRVAAQLLSTGAAASDPDRFEERDREHTAKIIDLIRDVQRRGDGFDLVHDKSGHFFKYASAIPAPVLATLHLPPQLYDGNAFSEIPGNVSFNCVSQSQLHAFTHLPRMQRLIENGIDVSRFPFCTTNRDYLLWMGRICEEKGTHVAIDVAEQAGLPLIIVGQVYPFSYHQQYFAREVAPRIERARVKVQFIQKPSFTEKLNLLQNARALLIPALIDETSSLVGMEAMACGTPVLAFRRGALPEVVSDKLTGFIVDSPAEMAEATKGVNDISPEQCRARVEQLFDSRRMAAEYENLYRCILGKKADTKAA